MDSIWPSWDMSRSLTWMKATMAVGMAAKMIAGAATAPSRSRFEEISRHSFPNTVRIRSIRMVLLPHQLEVDLLEGRDLFGDGHDPRAAGDELARRAPACR